MLLQGIQQGKASCKMWRRGLLDSDFLSIGLKKGSPHFGVPAVVASFSTPLNCGSNFGLGFFQWRLISQTYKLRKFKFALFVTEQTKMKKAPSIKNRKVKKCIFSCAFIVYIWSHAMTFEGFLLPCAAIVMIFLAFECCWISFSVKSEFLKHYFLSFGIFSLQKCTLSFSC